MGKVSLGEEEGAFFYYLGRALSAWSFVEVDVRNVALLCTNTDLQSKALAVGLASIDGVKAKLDFVDGLVGRHFPGERREWAGLIKTARALSWKRNKLAHWPVALYEQNDPGRRFLLSPWIHQKPRPRVQPKRPIPPDGCLGLRDIVKCDIEFTHFAMTLQNFSARVQGVEEPHAEGREPPIHPPTTAQLVVRMREALANPRGSFG